MPKFDIGVELTIKMTYTTRPILKIEAESKEAAEKYVDELLDKLETTGSCKELPELDEAFVNLLKFDPRNCDKKMYMTDILPVMKSE